MEEIGEALCFAFGIIVLFMGYYLAYVVRKPQIVSQPRSFISIVIKQCCPFVHEFYWPTFWCFGGRAQTVIANVLKSRPLVHYSRELLHMPDGGIVALDWVNTGNPATRLTVLILPGLTGTSANNYIRHFVLQITQELDCPVVVLNNRGLDGLPLITPRVCCAADTDDLEYVVFHIKKTKPDFPLMVVGISLGGIILTNLLCKAGEKENSNLDDIIFGAAVISTPWNLFKTSESLEKPLNWLLFNRHLTKLLQKTFKQHITSSNLNKLKFSKLFDINHALNSRTVREFDDRIIAPMSGYKDGDDYYAAATLHFKPLEKINVPLLCLNAADDPFAPEESIPFALLHRCPNVAMVLTRHGGHVGFTEGLFPRGSGIVHLLPEDICLIAIDFPGHGKSSHRWPGMPYIHFEYIADVKKVVSQLGWGKFSIIGHSIGAGVAALYAGTFPHEVQHLILIDFGGPSVKLAEKTAFVLAQYATQMSDAKTATPRVYQSVESAAERRQQKPYLGTTLCKEDAMLLAERGTRIKENGVIFSHDPMLIDFIRPFYVPQWALISVLSKIQCAVLVLEATDTVHDSVNRAALLERLKVICQSAKFNLRKRIKGGHHIHLEKAEQVAQEINEFLALCKSQDCILQSKL